MKILVQTFTKAPQRWAYQELKNKKLQFRKVTAARDGLYQQHSS
jgi:hypothetical protein